MLKTNLRLLLLFHPFLAFGGPLIFQAGPPERAPSEGGIAFPMREPEYRKFTSSGLPNLIPIRKAPVGTSADALYGYNFVVSGTNRGWVLDGDDQRGWILYLDIDGPGDLTNRKPEHFEKVNGVFTLVTEITDGGTHWPIRFQITHVKVENEEKLAVAIQVNTVRKGAIEIGGIPVPFTLTGSMGRYDRPNHRVAFDRKGAGELESCKISDRYVNLAGKPYAFSVDAAGDALTLEESETLLPDRPALKPGTQAPSFSGPDIDQKRHRSEDYRGQLLLLEFWSTSCGPCRLEAPKMAKFFNQSAHEKVAFLGISSDDSEDRLREFLKQTGISWPQIREPFEGAIHRSFRAEGEPTYFLLGLPPLCGFPATRAARPRSLPTHASCRPSLRYSSSDPMRSITLGRGARRKATRTANRLQLTRCSRIGHCSFSWFAR